MTATSWVYVITPFAAWLVAGVLKFAINRLRAGRLAFGLIGYGGLPSNHSALVASMASLIGLREGIAHPAFGVALTLAFIVVLDAASLRRQIGRQAEALNRLQADDPHAVRLRERMGHTRVEIAAGLVTGFVVAWLVNRFLG
jgi:acid phosphatase family membrane protein YuiD